MEQTFGSFVRQKRNEKTIKLNAFAKQIGISNVYLSYIETGKRPAPSGRILQSIVRALDLNNEETRQLYSLAVISHHKSGFPSDVLSYINSRPYVIETLRLAMRNNASEEDWTTFHKILDIKSNAFQKKE